MFFKFPYKGSCRHLRQPGALPLEAVSVRLVYPGQQQAAVEQVSVRVTLGQRVGLVGPNGSGKSSFLRAAAGLMPVQSGSLTLFGQKPGSCQHQVVYLPQRSDLDWDFPITVRRLILTGLYIRLGWLRRPGAQEHQTVEEVITLLDLQAVADKQIGQLSGGQQQRALIARTLMHDADLLLLDEPLNAIDAHTKALLLSLLDRLKAQGKTLLMSTHDLSMPEDYFDALIYLEGGKRGKGQGALAPLRIVC